MPRTPRSVARRRSRREESARSPRLSPLAAAPIAPPSNGVTRRTSSPKRTSSRDKQTVTLRPNKDGDPSMRKEKEDVSNPWYGSPALARASCTCTSSRLALPAVRRVRRNFESRESESFTCPECWTVKRRNIRVGKYTMGYATILSSAITSRRLDFRNSLGPMIKLRISF
ncbi:uncharacterized protein LOC112553002 [Pogonomyrmex barbatus]|uniref:Uncharacterized protein LOC112553002 n=1 Tax=Pogonomyrmex barbatus TaxID=144034 RepID=A0A8N1SBV6_9HYME|nr:uncharacterized protein LOC112553002 [Pogonomyrmex barbatus]